MLLIDTIIHEIVHKHGKRLIVAFADLKKPYDTVNRKFMVYKLKRKGCSGKFLKMMEAMMNNIIQIPKINGRLLPPITTLLGLKEGDNLNPCFSTHSLMMLRSLMTVAILLNSIMNYQSLALCR